MQRRFIKKADIALIAVVLCVGAALLIWRFLPSNGKTEAVIYAGGEVYRRVTLDKSADMTITIVGSIVIYHYNPHSGKILPPPPFFF